MMTKGEHVPGIDKTTDDRLNKVLNECRKLCRLNPHDTAGLMFLAELYDKLGQAQASATAYEKLLQARPSSTHFRLALAEQKLKQNQPEKIKQARKIYASIWDQPIFREDDWFRTQAAVAIAKLDSDQRSEMETLEDFLFRDPQNESLAYAKASALERQGNHEQALLLFRSFTITFIKSHMQAAAWFRLARLSPIEKSKPMLKKCLSLDPLHSGAKRLLYSLETYRVET